MPTPISQKKFIAVEGKDELNLLTALFKHMGLETLEARDVAGVTQFKDKIQALKNDPEFYKITSFGVIRDSNGSAEDAFRSVCGMLKSVGLAVPDRPLSMAAGKPSVAVMIMPGSNVEGQMLEDLCLEAVKEDPAMPCVADFFQCLEKTNLDASVKSPARRIVLKYLRLLHFFLDSARPIWQHIALIS